MISCFLLIMFLICGLYIAFQIFSDKLILLRIWLGVSFGLLLMIWTPIMFSFFFGFSLISHIVGLLFSIAITMLIFYLKKKEIIKTPKHTANLMQIFKHRKIRKSIIISLGFCVLLSCFISFLMVTHIYIPTSQGINSGQSTFGDLHLHTGIITNLAVNETFPPEYSIFKGVKIGYPFLGDSLSSTFYKFGLDLRMAILIPSFFVVFLLIFGFFILANEFLKSYYKSIFASILFFINGGLGFVYFINLSQQKPDNFNKIFTSFYKTPTNLPEEGLRWVNVIADMIIPQRTLLFGWAFVILAFWLLVKGISTKQNRYFVTSGIVAGLLPMIHTHSFLAFGIIVFVWFFISVFTSKAKLFIFKKWFIFGIVAFVLAFPQLMFWTIGQASQGNFLKFHFNWCNTTDPWLWFWVKNVGIVFLLIIPAFYEAKIEKKLMYIGPMVLFIISDLVVFQPNYYDNNKLFYIWYIFTVILVCDYLFKLWNKNKEFKSRYFIALVLIFVLTFSGVLTLIRETNSTYNVFSNSDIKASEFIKLHTPKDALFITADNHTNLVSTLTGRYIYCGSPSFLFFHGINISKRQKEIELMFTKPEENMHLFDDVGVDYVIITSWERNNYKPNENLFKSIFKQVYDQDGITIYAVSHRAYMYK